MDPRWQKLTERTLSGLDGCEPIYRPTNFWTPGVDRLVQAMENRGLDRFKSWQEAFSWFYPTYGLRLSEAETRQLVKAGRRIRPGLKGGRLREALSGLPDARRDFDAARLAWDQERWPFDLESRGESEVGQPVQRYPLTGPDGPRWGKPHLNYLLCLAALSRHVTAPPRSFLELGGGFGTTAQEVDHLPFGAYPVQVVRQVGGWDEDLAANEDFEFDYRLRQAGHRLLFDPRMVISWHCRQSIADLFRQYHRYGRGKVDVAWLHPESLQVRHLAPPAFVAYAAAGLLLNARHPTRWMAMLAPYAVALGAESVRSGRQLKTPAERIRLPPAFLAMHIGWGAGVWSGLRTTLLQQLRERLAERRRR